MSFKMQFEAASILDPAWLNDYKQQIKALYSQAVELNSYLFVLEKVLAFPFRLFAVGETTFWTLTVNAFSQAFVLCAWRIAVDTDGDFLTLRRFKNALVQNVRDPAAEAALREELRRIDFERRVTAVATKLTELRHRAFAHFQPPFLQAAQGKTPLQLPPLTVGELREVRDAVNDLIEVLGIETGHLFLTPDYDPAVKHPVNVDPRPDIERLLDSIAEQSSLIHMPEREPGLWPYQRENLSAEELVAYNSYRRKLGLAEIP